MAPALVYRWPSKRAWRLRPEMVLLLVHNSAAIARLQKEVRYYNSGANQLWRRRLTGRLNKGSQTQRVSIFVRKAQAAAARSSGIVEDSSPILSATSAGIVSCGSDTGAIFGALLELGVSGVTDS